MTASGVAAPDARFGFPARTSGQIDPPLSSDPAKSGADALDSPQRAAVTGQPLPIVFGKRVGAAGGVLVSSPASEARFENDATNAVTASYLLVISEGAIEGIQVRDVFQQSCRVGTFTQAYNSRAGNWGPGNFIETQTGFEDSVPNCPIYCGSAGGSYEGMTTGSFVNTIPNGFDQWNRQVHTFIRGGMVVPQLLAADAEGSSNNVADLVRWMMRKSSRIPEVLIDQDALRKAALFTDQNGLWCNIYLEDSSSLAGWLSSNLQYFLLRESRARGQRGLRPLLPTNNDGSINVDTVSWVYTFTADNIIQGTFDISYRPLAERQPFAVQVIWRQQPEDGLGLARTSEIRYGGSALDGPYEQHDLSQFATTEHHAYKVGTYILARRRYVDHTVSFAVKPGDLGVILAVGDIVRVRLRRVANVGSNTIHDYLYEVERITRDALGSVVFELTHLPVDDQGRNLVALDVSRAVGAGIILPTGRAAVNCDINDPDDDTVPPDIGPWPDWNPGDFDIPIYDIEDPGGWPGGVDIDFDFPEWGPGPFEDVVTDFPDVVWDVNFDFPQTDWNADLPIDGQFPGFDSELPNIGEIPEFGFEPPVFPESSWTNNADPGWVEPGLGFTEGTVDFGGGTGGLDDGGPLGWAGWYPAWDTGIGLDGLGTGGGGTGTGGLGGAVFPGFAANTGEGTGGAPTTEYTGKITIPTPLVEYPNVFYGAMLDNYVSVTFRVEVDKPPSRGSLALSVIDNIRVSKKNEFGAEVGGMRSVTVYIEEGRAYSGDVSIPGTINTGDGASLLNCRDSKLAAVRWNGGGYVPKYKDGLLVRVVEIPAMDLDATAPFQVCPYIGKVTYGSTVPGQPPGAPLVWLFNENSVWVVNTGDTGIFSYDGSAWDTSNPPANWTWNYSTQLWVFTGTGTPTATPDYPPMAPPGPHPDGPSVYDSGAGQYTSTSIAQAFSFEVDLPPVVDPFSITLTFDTGTVATVSIPHVSRMFGASWKWNPVISLWENVASSSWRWHSQAKIWEYPANYDWGWDLVQGRLTFSGDGNGWTWDEVTQSFGYSGSEPLDPAPDIPSSNPPSQGGTRQPPDASKWLWNDTSWVGDDYAIDGAAPTPPKGRWGGTAFVMRTESSDIVLPPLRITKIVAAGGGYSFLRLPQLEVLNDDPENPPESPVCTSVYNYWGAPQGGFYPGTDDDPPFPQAQADQYWWCRDTTGDKKESERTRPLWEYLNPQMFGQ